MLNGVVWFILGFMLATIYGNIFVADKAKRKADEYDVTGVDGSSGDTVVSRSNDNR
ncbi:hypothetical protein [Paenilisteria newyorkensis]|uniref:hypothetical protein n=1 Tax=Listeria newyorkensis TaxID=1497681 RepID=UPI000669BCA7|nr:hypothetical protein [Listeria newyorkensis]KMT62698.1 hypothetical protein X559_0981 [Listeria newyorkensis]